MGVLSRQHCSNKAIGMRILSNMKALIVPLILFVVAFAQADQASVQKEIEARYAKLAEAHVRGDLKAIVGLKTDDFYSIGPDGKLLDAKYMAEYSKGFLEQNKPPLIIKNTIRSLVLSPNETVAIATVFQEVSRNREKDGKLTKVETNVVQDETWVKTRHGWKLQCVQNVHDMHRWEDGVQILPKPS